MLLFSSRWDPKARKWVPRFYMCGKLSSFAELHRTAHILLLLCEINTELSTEEVLAMPFDQDGKLDISTPQTPVYNDMICRYLSLIKISFPAYLYRVLSYF